MSLLFRPIGSGAALAAFAMLSGACQTPPPSRPVGAAPQSDDAARDPTSRPGPPTTGPNSDQALGDALAAPPPVGLDDRVVPLGYFLDLDLDPDRLAYRGEVTIFIDIKEPARVLWLNSENLAIDGATLRMWHQPEDRSGTEERPIEIGTPELEPRPGLIGLPLAEQVPAGKAVLNLRFRGALGSQVGLFRQETEGRYYIFTDFEPIDARRAFPCFDQPRFKTTWSVHLRVPDGMLGLSNMPVESQETMSDGRTYVHFEQTRPLPSYLVAMAVGPFDVVEAPRARLGEAAGSTTSFRGYPPSDVALRVIVPKGKSRWAGQATRLAGPLLDQVADYMAMPVPFPKLDFISVPRLGGAMENPGLITVGSHILLHDPARPSLPRQRLLAKVLVHESVHLWFGDLVTPRNWNDLWLNEGFATWLTDKILDQWDGQRGGAPGGGSARAKKPPRPQPLERAAEKHQALTVDGFPEVRAVRQVGSTREELQRAFDPLSYLKGGAILTMVEGWMGPELFHAAVREYVAEHADGNADAGSFLAVLSRQKHPRAGLVAGVMQSFLERPGAPLVRAELVCDRGEAQLVLSQRRFRNDPGGTSAAAGGPDSGPGGAWQVPVCVRYDIGRGRSKRQCGLLDDRAGRFELDTPRCPAWLVPNADGLGYYRHTMSPRDLEALARAPLSEVERLDTMGTLRALMRSGDLSPSQVLALVPRVASGSSRQVAEATIEMLEEIADHLLDDAPARGHPGRFQALVRGLYSRRGRALGFVQRRGESDEDTLMRPILVPFVARYGGDPVLIGQATTLTRRWLRTGSGIERGMIEATLGIAAFHGDAGLYGAMEKALETPLSPKRRERVLGAMAAFRQPALIERAIARLSGMNFDLTAHLVQALLKNPAARGPAIAHIESIADKLFGQDQFLLITPLIAGESCTEEEIATIEALAGKAAVARELTGRLLNGKKKRGLSCSGFRSRSRDQVQAYFR